MNKKLLLINMLVGLMILSSVSAYTTFNRQERIDGLFNNIDAYSGDIDSLTCEDITVETINAEYGYFNYIYGSRINLNNGAFNVQGNWIWNSFSSLGIVINDNLKVNELHTGNNSGSAVCIDTNGYLCECGFCA